MSEKTGVLRLGIKIRLDLKHPSFICYQKSWILEPYGKLTNNQKNNGRDT